jgi:hypothetical protein
MPNGKKQSCEKAMQDLKDITTSWAKMAQQERDLKDHLATFTSLETQAIINQMLENERQRAQDIGRLLNFVSVECYLED